ncbi:hypothetical protein PTTG_06445 [Puccinia triticina 1-1 BBBD Race 1]|uniref:OTU domain-containing protein n=1 Tax=Puccinia triticina (isolate 1-1 / race 1 (BBBD)) TaxID=630390 RepID=A0A0C4F029_PUCT1|nr:hypothetical protein PTTG_06445 [Puccinia triticina 1-1 BBBD Race 1]
MIPKLLMAKKFKKGLTNQAENMPSESKQESKADESKSEAGDSETSSEVNKAPESEKSNQSEPDEKVDPLLSALQRYRHQCPPALLSYINQIFDPSANGHCGFRAVARALGYDDEDGCYQLLGGTNKVRSIINGWDVGNEKGPVTRAKWLNKLSHGQILADV